MGCRAAAAEEEAATVEAVAAAAPTSNPGPGGQRRRATLRTMSRWPRPRGDHAPPGPQPQRNLQRHPDDECACALSKHGGGGALNDYRRCPWRGPRPSRVSVGVAVLCPAVPTSPLAIFSLSLDSGATAA